MKKIKPGAGFTIFLLFFGIALLETIRTRNWLMVIFWIAIGILFLLLDNRKKPKNTRSHLLREIIKMQDRSLDSFTESKLPNLFFEKLCINRSTYIPDK